MAGKNKKHKKSHRGNILFVICIMICVCVMLCVISVQAQQKLEYDTEIQALQEEISKANEKSTKLQEQIEYQDSDEFIEELARERLNLVKSNEIVFVDKNK